MVVMHAVEKDKAGRGDRVCGQWGEILNGVFREGHPVKVTLEENPDGDEVGSHAAI